MKGNHLSDEIGKNTLDIIGKADQFNSWMFETISPFSEGRILEIGSGLGNISSFFLDGNYEIMLTDLREEYLFTLKKKFSKKRTLLGVDQLNLIHPKFEEVYKEHLERYHTVFALNVIEHIEDDRLAISNCKKLLKHNGRLIILVPSYPKLYNQFDEELDHFRRYTIPTLSTLFTDNNFDIIHQQYFNLAGILGWYISGNLMKRKTIPATQMKLYNFFVPLFKKLDSLINHKSGLSTIIVGRKSE